ncbi:tetratricopeptide repeat protein [Methylomonas albis]|uniref:Sel1 repeat family protein n=1 Tax=Methylomonas albis TaxID=1854563 RepID=A0ABR9D6K2_9GAMM|nr:tetratricopeptide repeat protein [Methylomonas albis]MBD9357923.1 sel1 repeat family protein [Methylomonas albis]
MRQKLCLVIILIALTACSSKPTRVSSTQNYNADLISSTINPPVTLAFAEGLITGIPAEKSEKAKIPSTATKKDIEWWSAVAEDTKNNLFLCNREGLFAKLGVVYAMGYGVQKDEKAAVKWFTKAASYARNEHDGLFCESVHIAEYNLGVMYENGLGVTKNQATALEWYTKAEAGNNSSAQLKMGYLYGTGSMGVKKDVSKPVSLFSKANSTGYGPHRVKRIALRNLGFIANGGLGDQKDQIHAYVFYASAAREGDAESQAPADGIRATLTATQLGEAETLLKKIPVKKYSSELIDAEF